MKLSTNLIIWAGAVAIGVFVALFYLELVAPIVERMP